MLETDPRWAAAFETAAQAAAHVPRMLAFEYAATAVGQPFEVVRILLQVQWSPQRQVPAQLTSCADADSQTMAAGTAYRLILPSPPPPPSPPPEPEQPEQPAEPDAEAPKLDPNLASTSDEPPIAYPPSKELTDPEADPGDTDAGAILTSVWADPPSEEPRYAPPPRPPTPSPELWPEAEADWASDTAPPTEEERDTSSPQLVPEVPVERSEPGSPPRVDGTAEQNVLPAVSLEPKQISPPTPIDIRPASPSLSDQDRCTLPIIYTGGLWDMSRAVMRGSEGWPALFKGTSTTFVLEALERIMVPSLHRLLAAATGLPSVAAGLALAVRGGGGAAVAGAALALAPFPWQAWGASVLSHSVVRMALVPLDTLRTRAVAQSSLPEKRKYPAPWGTLPGLRMMAYEEGGWAKLWLAPHIFWPALLDCTVRPCILLATPLFVDKMLPYDGAQPATTARVLLSLACQISALLVTLPLEAVRRRMQVQPRFDIAHHARALAARGDVLPEPADRCSLPDLPIVEPYPLAGPGTGYLVRIKGLRTCVETRPLPYRGVMDAFLRIVREETSTPPWAVTDPNALMPTSGIYSLYRGFSIASMTLLAEAALALLLGEATPTGIWAEV